MKHWLFILVVELLFIPVALTVEPEPSCEQTVEILKQTIEVKEITNKTLKALLDKKDSIIFAQDSTIVKLQSK